MAITVAAPGFTIAHNTNILNDMDIKCQHCGEPWDAWFLREELSEESPADLAALGWKFGSSRLNVKTCEACKGTPEKKAAGEYGAVAAVLAEMLGDDEDGLAAELDDLGAYLD